jgi:acetyl-CoA acetyltransferase
VSGTGRDAVLVGVAESDLGITQRSALDLEAQAVTRALADAGLGLADVDGLATVGAPRFPAVQVAEYLGVRPRWTDTTFAGGASALLHLVRAAEAVRAGHAEVVVVSFGSDQRSSGRRRLGGTIDPAQREAQFDAPYGPLNPVSFYAMAAERHAHEHGTTPEQLAEVAVAARAWALRNPVAYRHDAGPLTVDDVLASELVSSPLRVLDCCLVTDGGGAVVVTSAARAADLPRPAVRLLGHGEATTHHGMSQVPDLTSTGAVDSGRDAFARAGLTPGDVDVLQVYDSFTITVLLSLEGLGFCAPGEGGAFVAGGRLGPGGSLPTTTSGGGLSYAHPGMFGVLLLVEAVRQLRGDAGDRQVPDAEVALCHATGGILSSHATVLLGVDR